MEYTLTSIPSNVLGLPERMWLPARFSTRRPIQPNYIQRLASGKRGGNWCGWGYTAEGEPIDATDAACREHDIRYEIVARLRRALEDDPDWNRKSTGDPIVNRQIRRIKRAARNDPDLYAAYVAYGEYSADLQLQEDIKKIFHLRLIRAPDVAPVIQISNLLDAVTIRFIQERILVNHDWRDNSTLPEVPPYPESHYDRTMIGNSGYNAVTHNRLQNLRTNGRTHSEILDYRHAGSVLR
jgi:hypothetical protein